LNGQISKGDYQKVVALLRAYQPLMAKFVLISPGGDVDEALKIGRLFRKYLILTEAPLRFSDGDTKVQMGFGKQCRGQNCGTCASACALIWFGGVDRGGTVGLHRPRIEDPEFKGLSPADASIVYRRVLARIAAYLDEMEVPKPIIESMIATGSGDIRWVDSFDDQLDRPPSIAEWVAASCGSGEYKDQFACELKLFDNHRERLAPP
jgi:hypothetical protein